MINLLLTSWREWKYWLKRVRSAYRTASEIHRKKGNKYEVRLKTAVSNYLSICREISQKVKSAMTELVIGEVVKSTLTECQKDKVADLRYYEQMLNKQGTKNILLNACNFPVTLK